MSGYLGGFNNSGGGGGGGGSNIIGPTGPAGIPGPTGPTGPTGDTGISGTVGPTGPIGAGESSSIYACTSNVSILDMVYLGSNDIVDQAIATDIHRAAIGIVESKSNSTTAKVLYSGEISGFSNLIPGSIYYLSETLGQVSIVAPIAKGSIVQIIGFAKDSNTLMIEIDESVVLLS